MVTKIISVFLLLCCFVGNSIAADANDRDKRLAKLEKNIEEINKTLSAMSSETFTMSMALDKSGKRPVVIQETIMRNMVNNGPEAEAFKTMDTKMAEEQQLHALCSMEEWVDVGVVYKIMMKDKDGGELFTLNLDLSKCRK